jgi:hypothetical protein
MRAWTAILAILLTPLLHAADKLTERVSQRSMDDSH